MILQNNLVLYLNAPRHERECKLPFGCSIEYSKDSDHFRIKGKPLIDLIMESAIKPYVHGIVPLSYFCWLVRLPSGARFHNTLEPKEEIPSYIASISANLDIKEVYHIHNFISFWNRYSSTYDWYTSEDKHKYTTPVNQEALDADWDGVEPRVHILYLGD